MTRVMVIGGGRNCEHEIGLASAAGVSAGLRKGGFDVDELTISQDGLWLDPARASIGLSEAVRRIQHADVVFPAVHGPRGEDGTLAALCVLADVPVVGSDVTSGAIGMDKWATKIAAEAVGVATAKGSLVSGPTTFTGPCVVKPARAGSSHGASLVESDTQWAPALEAAFALDDRVLVEDIQIGREIDIAILRRSDGSLLLGPPLEVHIEGLFNTDTKYDGTAEFLIPAPLSDPQLRELREAAIAVFEAIGCRGVARVDFFLTEVGWVLNEINTMPGMTEESQVPKMFAAIGMDYPSLLTELVEAAR